MNKDDIKEGMKLKMKNGSFCTSFLHKGNICFRFRDGTNDFVSLEQYDENLNCGFDGWSIVSEWTYNLIPASKDLPKSFKVKHIKTGKIYSAFYHDVASWDEVHTETVQRACNFNECEGRIDNTLFEDKVMHYYIYDKYGQKIPANDIVLVDELNNKDTLSYKSLCEIFEYVE